LEGAIGIDKTLQFRKENHKFVPHHTFQPTLFRQPSLAEGRLKPSSYRKSTSCRLLPNYETNDGTQKIFKHNCLISKNKSLVSDNRYSDSDDSVEDIKCDYTVNLAMTPEVVKSGSIFLERSVDEKTCLLQKM
jgi:hypothetical protein